MKEKDVCLACFSFLSCLSIFYLLPYLAGSESFLLSSPDLSNNDNLAGSPVGYDEHERGRSEGENERMS